MKKYRNAILQGMVSRVRQLLERYEESKSIRHDTTKGSLREAYLKDFVSEIVPPGLSTSSGFVTDNKGAEISPQLDLLIYDSYSLPGFIMSEFTTIVPLEAARLSIEVKSILKQDCFEQIKKQQETIRKMRYSWTTKNRTHLYTTNCLGLPQFVAAFETACSQDTLMKWFEEEPMLTVICVIDKFCILRDPNTSKPAFIATDENYLDVMQFVTRLHGMLAEDPDNIRKLQIDTAEGKLLFQPDYGAYLTFDVPDRD